MVVKDLWSLVLISFYLKCLKIQPVRLIYSALMIMLDLYVEKWSSSSLDNFIEIFVESVIFSYWITKTCEPNSQINVVMVIEPPFWSIFIEV